MGPCMAKSWEQDLVIKLDSWMGYLLHENGSSNSLQWPREVTRKLAMCPGLSIGTNPPMKNKIPKPMICTDMGSEITVPL